MKALLLLAVYTVLATVPAFASLTCRCYSHHTQHNHSCCCCHKATSCQEHDLHYQRPCTCGHNHSTEVALYTYQPSDNERTTQRIAVVELPEALLSERLGVEPSVFRSITSFLRDERVRSGPTLFVRALRAPPVLV